MAKLPSYRRIIEKDYPEESQDLVRQLSVSINAGFEALYDLLNGKLTIKDNVSSTIREFDVTVNASGTPTAKTSIKKSNTEKIEGLWVIKVTNLTNSSTYPSSGVVVSYTETTDSIIIDNITGLSANNNWRLKVIALK